MQKKPMMAKKHANQSKSILPVKVGDQNLRPAAFSWDQITTASSDDSFGE